MLEDDFIPFYQKNDTINLQKLWESKYKNASVIHVSYPLYNNKTKIAVIKTHYFEPKIRLCGVGMKRTYLFEKTKNGWMEKTSFQD